MANRARQATAAMVAAMTLMTARHATAGEETETLTLVLRVENHADVSSEILRRAEEQATRTYDAIGVRTIWVHDDTTDPVRGAVHLRVLLLSPAMAARKIAAEKVADNVLGQATAVTRRAYLFADRIATVAAKHQRPCASVLGAVLAHEVVHMVLPARSHSDTGIMRANLDVQTTAPQYFTAAQGALIRGLGMAADANQTRAVDAADAAVSAR